MTKRIEWVTNEKGCHLCVSHAIQNSGYIQYRNSLRNNEMDLMHRVVYEKLHGFIPHGMVIMHTCDNRTCINPEHLKLGTQSENLYDCVAKGRKWKGYQKVKEYHPQKLFDCTHLLELRKSKGISRTWLSEQTGISYTQLWRLENGIKKARKNTYDKIMKILGGDYH